MFHIRWISILRFLYFNLFSVSFSWILSNSIATSISKQIFYYYCYFCDSLWLQSIINKCDPSRIPLHCRPHRFISYRSKYFTFHQQPPDYYYTRHLSVAYIHTTATFCSCLDYPLFNASHTSKALTPMTGLKEEQSWLKK
jgi:hypothetical protein